MLKYAFELRRWEIYGAEGAREREREVGGVDGKRFRGGLKEKAMRKEAGEERGLGRVREDSQDR